MRHSSGNVWLSSYGRYNVNNCAILLMPNGTTYNVNLGHNANDPLRQRPALFNNLKYKIFIWICELSKTGEIHNE